MGKVTLPARIRPPTCHQLLALAMIKRREVLNAKQLAFALGITHSNANHLINRLQAKGLLKRKGLEVVE